MEYDIDAQWSDDFILTRSTLTTSERAALARRAHSGELVRVSRGAYLPAAVRAAHGPRRRHRDLVGARVLTGHPTLTFSHESAASLWRLPRIGPWPSFVHALAEAGPGGRSSTGMRRHADGRIEGDRIDGIRVTTLARTVVDLARSTEWEDSVVAADAALRIRKLGRASIQVTRAELIHELESAGRRGIATAHHVVEFANGLAGSPGETLSRVSIARARLTPPVLQQRFDDEYGAMFGDFFWPDFGVLGEFDGVGKYLREEWMDGRTAGQVVVDEKWREDRLRRQCSHVVRWGWDLARHPTGLARLLRSAGVR